MQKIGFNKRKHFWTVETESGTHEVYVKMGQTTNHPIEVFLDDRRVEKIINRGHGFIPSIEYDFACGDETLTFILYGNNVDLAYKGKLLKYGTPYSPKDALPKWYTYLVTLLTIGAGALVVLLCKKGVLGSSFNPRLSVFAIVMSSCWGLIAYKNASSVLYTKKKKIIFSLLSIFASAAISFLVLFILGDSFFKMLD